MKVACVFALVNRILKMDTCNLYFNIENHGECVLCMKNETVLYR